MRAAALGVALVVCASCASPSPDVPAEVAVVEEESEALLQAEEARRALIVLLEERPQDALTMTLPSLRRGERAGDGAIVKIGAWRLDLEAKTFYGAVWTGGVAHDATGRFERPAGSRGWRAVVTEERRACR
ncbi:MAG: hypothetical protein M9894_18690 [Planctomycetes bacterium]|nr:hypothetical protein [Planctomycetota bacterium]